MDLKKTKYDDVVRRIGQFNLQLSALEVQGMRLEFKLSKELNEFINREALTDRLEEIKRIVPELREEVERGLRYAEALRKEIGQDKKSKRRTSLRF